MRNKVVKNLGTPVDAKDAVTKEYVDTAVEATEQHLIPTFEQLSTMAVLSAKDYSNTTFVALDNVQFEYIPAEHALKLIYGGKD